MFQQTIQDAISLAEAGPRPEDLLEVVRSRILTFERFECAELVTETESGLLHFVAAPGLGERGMRLLSALGDQPTLRLDTAEQLRELGLEPAPNLTSILALRLEAPGTRGGAIILGHSRAWSFAAAPLSRIRSIGSIALRLLFRNSRPLGPSAEETRLGAEVARLRAQISGLEKEVVALRAERAARKDSDRPR